MLMIAFVNQAFAWNFRGHVLIAELAYSDLNAKDQTQVNRYADRIYSQLSHRAKVQLSKNYPNTNHFAKLAALPDSWRKRSLHDIFSYYHAPLPITLQPYADETTNNWHFINQPYGNNNCQPSQNRNIVWAINLFKKAWDNSQNPNTKALIMVFLEHLVGDIYQPLHTFSRYNAKCRNDLGGNDVYVKSGRYSTNLHRLWDSGVGYLTHKINFSTKAKRIKNEFPKKQFASQLKNTNPTSWAKSNLQYAPFVYSVKAGAHISQHYYQKGQWVARHQIAQAGYRLANILKPPRHSE